MNHSRNFAGGKWRVIKSSLKCHDRNPTRASPKPRVGKFDHLNPSDTVYSKFNTGTPPRLPGNVRREHCPATQKGAGHSHLPTGKVFARLVGHRGDHGCGSSPVIKSGPVKDKREHRSRTRAKRRVSEKKIVNRHDREPPRTHTTFPNLEKTCPQFKTSHSLSAIGGVVTLSCLPTAAGNPLTPEVGLSLGAVALGTLIVLGIVLAWLSHRSSHRSARKLTRGQKDHTNHPLIRAGGGPWRSSATSHKIRSPTAGPSARYENWMGEHAKILARKEFEEIVGGSLAPSTKRLYARYWGHWDQYRRAKEREPWLNTSPLTLRDEEEDVLIYLTLQTGPLSKSAGTARTMLQAISHYHKCETGQTPFANMNRIAMWQKGMDRRSGPPHRKLPVGVDILRAISSHLLGDHVNKMIAFCTILLGWYLGLRKSEYLLGEGWQPPGRKAGQRRPISMVDLEPKWKGALTQWWSPFDEVSAHLHGSKTDWLNRGSTRSVFKLSANRGTAHICLIASLRRLARIFPARFQKPDTQPFARWANGKPIKDHELNQLVREGASAMGYPTEHYSLHSLRSGGATALWSATKNSELVKRFFRWKSDAFTSYLWDQIGEYREVSNLMTRVNVNLHQSAPRGPEPWDKVAQGMGGKSME